MGSYNRVYTHFVWATLEREKSIRPEDEPVLYRSIAAACRKVKGIPLEIGGVEDHVHALVRMPGTLCSAEAAKAMKGSSSHLHNTLHGASALFRWQGGYASRSVSPDDMHRVKEYIRNQKAHHAANTLDEDLERIDPPDDEEDEDAETEW